MGATIMLGGIYRNIRILMYVEKKEKKKKTKKRQGRYFTYL